MSNIKWIGSKVTESHYGTINIDRGVLQINEEGELVGGEFVIDMNSLLCTDIENEIYKKKLEDHLKDEDFFDVEKFSEILMHAYQNQMPSNLLINRSQDYSINLVGPKYIDLINQMK